MSSRDPWDGVPNLSGLTAADADQTRVGDPSRFYPGPGSGGMDPMAGRLLNMPRCKVTYAAGNAGYGGGASFLPFDTKNYDTDNMVGTAPYQFLTCKTPGLYLVNAQSDLQAVAGGVIGTWIRLSDPSNTISYGQHTDYHDLSAWGGFLSVTAFWYAGVGDQIGCYLTSTLTVNVTAGSSFLQACMISSIGSDSQ